MNNKALLAWFVVLLVLGGIFLAYKSTQTKPKPAPAVAITPTPKTSQTAVDVTLDPVAGSPVAQSGKAALTEEEGKVKVTVNLTGGTKVTNPQPIHVHTGTCATPGGVVYPLTNVVDGKSDTTLNVDMKTLLATGTLINVHKSAAELSVYTACGEFPKQASPEGAMEQEEATPSPTVSY